MKNKLTLVLLLLCGLGMIIFPKITSAGAASGLLQWYRSVLPTLLPFLLLAKLAGILFPISGSKRKLSICLMGFLCGYPMGAVLAAGEVKSGGLSREEGQWLLGLCNLPSPAFLTGLVAVEWLHMPHPYRLLLSVWLASLTCSFILWILSRRKRGSIPRDSPTSIKVTKSSAFTVALLENAWMDSCKVAVIICCYMVLFSILSSWLSAIYGLPDVLQRLLLLLCEITTGCRQIADSTFPPMYKEMLCAAGAAFGGLSCLAQTSGCIQGANLSLLSYAKAKVSTAILAVLFMRLFA